MVSSLWSGLVWWLCCVARIGKPRSRTIMFFIHRTLVYSDDPVPVRSDWIPSTHFATLLQFEVVVGPTRPQRDDNACVWCLRQKGSLWCTCWDEDDEEEWEWRFISWFAEEEHWSWTARALLSGQRRIMRGEMRMRRQHATRGCPPADAVALVNHKGVSFNILIINFIWLWKFDNKFVQMEFYKAFIIKFQQLNKVMWRMPFDWFRKWGGGVSVTASGRLFKRWFIESRWQWVN